MAFIAVTEGAAVAASGGLAVCAVLSLRKRRSSKAAAVAAVLSMLVFFLLLFGIFDYLSFRMRHRRLSAGLAEPLLAADALPPAATAVEADYPQLLRALQKRCSAQEQEAALAEASRATMGRAPHA